MVQGVPSVIQQSEWVFGYLFFPKPLLKRHAGSYLRGILVPCKAYAQLEWLVQTLGRFGKHHLRVQLLVTHTLNQCHGTARFHPRLSHKGTFVNMELTASQGLYWFWTEYKEEWQRGRGKENLGGEALNYPTVITLISGIPCPAPVLQPPWLQRKYFCPLSQKAKVQVWGLHVYFLSPPGDE